ncbi:DUF3572 domain-containing protein [Rhizorhapis sp.]|uniref:DUF3572 domain-containing protein n=1 Tax=Rhizorhapis sp. TaxID=1968842 RepID=UPI002B4A3EC9|nr:DUF3572 domain-containing protein [Rhizorhapis sp.]HKR18085.1 DUF3572 domain-containing protein [Rhizorhapis sp.]HKX36031.1 DUF3572 domain-containing protein [Rhizorhapis sp.]
MKPKSTNADDPEMVALAALGWILGDDRRAERLLSVTGMTPEGLRAGVNERAVLGAVLSFLLGHEPDLLACAEAMNMRPEDLAAAGRDLE